jgi:hypothetical protein
VRRTTVRGPLWGIEIPAASRRRNRQCRGVINHLLTAYRSLIRRYMKAGRLRWNDTSGLPVDGPKIDLNDLKLEMRC